MSTLNVDALVGVSSANAITVRGEGSATTSLQQGLAKSWINFNGTGTIAVQDSLNVSSVSDGGTGIYVASFSSNMGNINYSGCAAGNGGTDYNAMGRLTELAAGSCKMLMGYTGGYYDNVDTSYIISGDLA
jgi:hypothetical protein